MATGTFTLAGWDEEVIEEQPSKLSRARIEQTWQGDAMAEVVSHNLMHYAEDGSATIVGLLRFTGSVGDRSGTFVAHGIGAYDGEQVRTDLTITPGSGTGDFAGVSGTGTFAAPKGPEGTWSLELS
jgi:hypothetical protein